MPVILIFFFVKGLCYGAKQVLFLPSVSRWKVMKLTFPSYIISWGFFLLQIQDLISGAMQLKHVLWLRGWKTRDMQTFKWWICTGENPLYSSLAGMTSCWMFQRNKVFFYIVFPRSVQHRILFEPITITGCHQKNCWTLLISSISRSSLFCFGFQLNQSQGTKPISRNVYCPDCKPIRELSNVFRNMIFDSWRLHM